jgi:hypothetical protein
MIPGGYPLGIMGKSKLLKKIDENLSIYMRCDTLISGHSWNNVPSTSTFGGSLCHEHPNPRVLAYT